MRGFSPESKALWSFATDLSSVPGGMALAKHSVYLLLQGKEEGSPAMVAYDLAGNERGRWGEMPADGIIQSSLNGGGITACPNGSVFYSYINSPQVSKLDARRAGGVHLLAGTQHSFKMLAPGEVRNAYRESERAHSVAPIVRLGLRGSRVTALLCSAEGYLFRQVARPARGGSYIEVWAPSADRLLGTIPSGSGILLAVRGHTLYLGNAHDEGFMLEPIEYRLPTGIVDEARR